MSSHSSSAPDMEPSSSQESCHAPSSPSLRKRQPQDFQFGEVLGEGSYSTVVYAREKSTDDFTTKEFAVKILDKRHIVKEKKVKYVTVEKDVLNRTRHPLIVRLYYTFQDSMSLYFVLEYAPNGDLLSYLKKFGRFDKTVSRFYAAEILVATQYLHSKGIIHRDLKPENILLDKNYHVRITDFGTARMSTDTPQISSDNDKSSRRASFVGTAEYCSPELLNDRAAFEASDIWAIGCMLYQFMSGLLPFKGSNEYQTFQKIIHLRYTFPKLFDTEALELVKNILVLDPTQRPTISQIQEYPFFAGFTWERLHKVDVPRPDSALDPLEIDEIVDAVVNLTVSDRAEDEVPGDENEQESGTPESERSLSETPEWDDKLNTFLRPNEQPLIFGHLVKKQTFISRRRGVLVTSAHRVLIYDPRSFEVVEALELPVNFEVVQNNHKSLSIHADKKVVTLEDKNGKIQEWVVALNSLKDTN